MPTSNCKHRKVIPLYDAYSPAGKYLYTELLCEACGIKIRRVRK